MSETLDTPRTEAPQEHVPHGRYFDKRCHEVRSSTAHHLRQFCDSELTFDADESIARSDLVNAYREFRGETISEAIAIAHVYDLTEWLRIRRIGDHYVGIGVKS